MKAKISDLNYNGWGYSVDGDFGIEVELEGRKFPKPPPGWRGVNEGSLRDGLEYVSDAPVPIKDKLSHIRALTSVLNDGKFKIADDLSRCSTHVHINVNELAPIHLISSMMFYYLIEDALTEHCGELREGNCFCLRLKDSEAFIDAIRGGIDWQQYGFMSNMEGTAYKYQAMNLGHVRTFGSVEFRQMRCLTQTGLLSEWVQTLYNIINKPYDKFGKPDQLLDYYYRTGIFRMAEQILPAGMVKSLNKETLEKGAEDNALLISQIAYEYNWDQWIKDGEKHHEKYRKGQGKYKKPKPRRVRDPNELPRDDGVRVVLDEAVNLDADAVMRAQQMMRAVGDGLANAQPQPPQPPIRVRGWDVIDDFGE